MRLRRIWLVLRRCESLAAFTRFVLHLRAANATTLGDTWLVKTEFNFSFCFVHLQFLDFFWRLFFSIRFLDEFMVLVLTQSHQQAKIVMANSNAKFRNGSSALIRDVIDCQHVNAFSENEALKWFSSVASQGRIKHIAKQARKGLWQRGKYAVSFALGRARNRRDVHKRAHQEALTMKLPMVLVIMLMLLLLLMMMMVMMMMMMMMVVVVVVVLVMVIHVIHVIYVICDICDICGTCDTCDICDI